MTTNLVGQTLGEYQLTQLIGEGGMATVYKAYQISLKRDVAVKVLYYQEDNSLVRFQREAKAIASLRHRNILIIYEYGEQDNHPYIAMEYVEGGTLEDRLNGEPMNWEQVINLAIPIADALQYAHSHGIIHRDIKPSNILMPQEDWPVLADFGLVKRSDEEQGLTMTGTFLGTPSYIAPEQARDVEVDYRADMYSLGVIMFEMVTGELPFDFENPNKILLAHVMDEPPRPSELNPDCPPALESIILRTLEKASEDRYADMQAMVKDLRAALNNPEQPLGEEEKTAKAAIKEELPPPVPIGSTTTEEAEPEPEPEEKSGGFFSRLFGGKKDKKPKKKDEDTASKTAPREPITVKKEELFDDGLDSTVQLDLGEPSAQLTPRIVLQDENVTIILPEDKEVMVVGRTYGDSIADIDLDPHSAAKYGVSRRHAAITKRGNQWQIEDLNSLNGTFVNEAEVKSGRPVTLQDGDLIRFSHMKFVFLLS